MHIFSLDHWRSGAPWSCAVLHMGYNAGINESWNKMCAIRGRLAISALFVKLIKVYSKWSEWGDIEMTLHLISFFSNPPQKRKKRKKQTSELCLSLGTNCLRLQVTSPYIGTFVLGSTKGPLTASTLSITSSPRDVSSLQSWPGWYKVTCGRAEEEWVHSEQMLY